MNMNFQFSTMEVFLLRAYLSFRSFCCFSGDERLYFFLDLPCRKNYSSFLACLKLPRFVAEHLTDNREPLFEFLWDLHSLAFSIFSHRKTFSVTSGKSLLMGSFPINNIFVDSEKDSLRFLVFMLMTFLIIKQNLSILSPRDRAS